MGGSLFWILKFIMEICIIAGKIDFSLVQYGQLRKRSTQICTIDFLMGWNNSMEKEENTINDA